RYFKPFSKQAFECVTLTSEDVAFPTIADAIELANITVEGAEKREKLENLSRHSNSMSQGYKITDDEASRYYDIFSFIQAHGFDVIQDGVRISIHARGQRSMSGGNSPALFLDDVPIDDASMLRSYSMRNVDEIYINKRGYGGGTTGPFGIIRIYTKKTQSSLHNIAIKSHSLVVKGGFQDYKEFVNPNYDSVQDEGFKKYVNIQWIPYVNYDEEGNFKLV